MIKLGITGGIGSGKSVVSHILSVMNIPVYQTDDESKRLVVENEDIRNGLTNLVGKDIYKPDGSLDKAMLANYIFGFPEHMQKVNNIIHPVVKQDFVRWANQFTDKRQFVAVECAILYESGFDALVDKTILVSAPLELRVKRAMLRDNAEEKQIRARIKHQMDEQLLYDKAQFIVSNDDEHLLIPQILEIIRTVEFSRN